MAHHLVIQLARFGDMVQTKRLLLSLAANANDTVHLAVDSSIASLTRIVYPFAVVHEIHAHAGGGSAAEVLVHNKGAFAALAAISFDSVYNLNFTGMAFSLAGLFNPDKVRGYLNCNGQILRSHWLRMGFRWMDNRRVAPVNLVDFWAYLHPDPIAPERVNPKAAFSKGVIAVVASGREARRSLPPEVLAPIVEAAFVAHGGPEVVILGGSAERAFARKLTRLFRPATIRKVKDFCGRTALTDLPEILAGCCSVLTPDTGIMHLAAHMGIPVQAFFLSSAWCFETGPYGEGHTVYQATRGCSPCIETQPCPFDTACLSPFGAPELLAKVRGNPLETWPKDLVAFHAVCDDFGCDYILDKGELAELPRRFSLRSLLAEYAGRGNGDSAAMDIAGVVFHESDWVLPPNGPRNITGVMSDLAEEG